LTVVDSSAASVYDYAQVTLLYQSSSSMSLSPGALNIMVNVSLIATVVSYKITYQKADGTEKTAYTGIDSVSPNIASLEPETAYTVKLYEDSGSGAGYELRKTAEVSTLANSVENYRADDFKDGSGKVKLNELDETARASMSKVLNDLFVTGDVMAVNSGRKELSAKFVKLGESVSIEDEEALLLPFDETSGASQTVNLTLSDGSTSVAVTYDETADTIAVDGSTYSEGDQFVLDGQRVSVMAY